MRKHEEIFIDPLTKLYNRRYLQFWINNEIKRAERFSQKFSILIIDIDYFKNINDSYGHLKGDSVLREFSKFIVDNIRDVDIPVRYGGDEFLIIFPFTNKESLTIILERLYENIQTKKFDNINITFSSGIAEFPSDGYKWETLFQYADKGLYRAKKLGRNQYAEATETEIKTIQIPSPVFVGRKEEFNFIKHSIESENKINIVTGEIGIGKTRIIKEIANYYKNNIFARGASFSSFQNIPFYSWRQIIQILHNEHHDKFFSSFYKLNNNYKYELKKIVPAIEWQTQESFDTTDKYTLYNAIISFLNDFSINNNLFLMFDDLQWTDRETLDLIHVVANTAISNIRIFAAFRTDSNETAEPINEFLIGLGRERIHNEIELAPLSKEETSILVSYILDAYPTPNILNFIYDSSGGNPFYVEEIIQNLFKNSFLEWSKEKEWTLKASEVMAPGSIRDIITAKFNNLDDISKEILFYISVIGRPVSMEFLYSLMNNNEGELLDAVDKLVDLNLLEEKESRMYFFREGIALKVIYSFINEKERIKMHNNIVNLIESKYINSIENHLDEIVYHAIKANNKKIMKRYIINVAEKAMEMFAYNDAIRYYNIALEILSDTDILVSILEKLVKIYNTLGNYDESYKIVKKYLKLKHFKDLKGKLYYLLATSALESDDFKNAKKYFNLALKHTSDPITLNKIDSDFAWLYSRLSEHEKALIYCYKLIAKKDLSVTLKGNVYNTMGAIYSNKRDYESAEKYYRKALLYRKTLKDKRAIAAIYNNLALLFSNHGRYKKSIKYFEKAYKIFEETSYVKGSIISLFDMSDPISRIKGYSKAMEILLEAERKAIILNNKYVYISVYINLSNIVLHLKKISTFFKYLDLVENYAKTTKKHRYILSVLFDKFEYYKYYSKDKTIFYYNKILETLKKYELKDYDMDVLLVRYEMLFYTDQFDEYMQQEKNILKNTTYENDTNNLEELYLHLALINSLKGEENKACKYIDYAIELVEKEDIYEKARINYIKGMAYKFLKDKQNSLNSFKGALRIFNKLDDYLYVDIINKQLDEIKNLSKK